jgi:Protein of unknown function (DUF3298)
MTAPAQVPPSSPKARWLWLALAGLLAGFTLLCWRDAQRSPWRPAAGGTFTGLDVDGRLVQVCLFEQDDGWQGWLYREGREQTEWFSPTNRVHPWQAVVEVHEYDDAPKLPPPLVASTGDPLRLNATLPRTNGWASDTANLTRQHQHLSYRRLTGFRLGGWGGTKEFRAQLPQLRADIGFQAAVTREIMRQCEADAREFTAHPLDFWRDNVQTREPMTMNTHALDAHWQLRLLTTNLASFCVWSYDQVGGNGNHSQWRGVNLAASHDEVRIVTLADLFRPAVNWSQQIRQRCVVKLRALGVPKSIADRALDPDAVVEHFTLSPTGLQIYFNPYEIASGADGEFVVHFDYAELKDLLRTDGPGALLPRAP